MRINLTNYILSRAKPSEGRWTRTHFRSLQVSSKQPKFDLATVQIVVLILKGFFIFNIVYTISRSFVFNLFLIACGNEHFHIYNLQRVHGWPSQLFLYIFIVLTFSICHTCNYEMIMSIFKKTIQYYYKLQSNLWFHVLKTRIVMWPF